MQASLMVGVDMAKKEFVAALFQEQAQALLGTFPNDVAGYEALAGQVSKACHQSGVVQVQLVIEATGGYEAALVAYAYGQDWLVRMPNPKQVRDWAKGVGYRGKSDRMDAQILAHYGVERRPKPRPQLAEEVSELDSLLKRRADLEQALQKEQTRLSELAGRPGVSPQVAESLRQVIEALTEALAGIQQAIDERCQSHQPFQQQLARLLALPGVGPKVVLPLMVKLFQWQTLTNGEGSANGLTAFVGLDPQPYESGGCPLGAVRKHPGISKMGDNELLRLLYMGALGGVRGDNPLMPFYQRLVGRGKAKKVALVAAARKILVWAWTIFSCEIDWNPNLHQIGA
jgi:transposase